MGGGQWRDRENHYSAEQLFREMEGDVGTGGLQPRSAHCLVPARGLWAVLRVISCRTATVWKTLCPFWGEEYEVHLPPTFHSVAFYVMDEDALRWAQPCSPSGAWTPPPVPLWDCGSLPPLYSLEGGGAQGTCRAQGLDVCSICVRVCGFAMLTPHYACMCVLGCVCMGV